MIAEILIVSSCLYTINKLFDYKRRKIKKVWQQVMKGAGIKNKFEQSFELLKLIETRYGFDAVISIPKGLSYEQLEKKIPEIEAGIGCVTELEWKRFENSAYLKCAIVEYNSKKLFKPVKTEPYELYFGETYFVENLTADMKEYPHVLFAGSTGTGKTRCLFICLTNLLYWNDNIDLFLAQVSDKKDLQKFAHYKQTKYFAQNIQTTDRLVKYLLEMQQERNKLLNQYNLNNIEEYNKKFPENNINYCYLAIDEAASLMPGDNKEVDPYFTIKKRIIFHLNELQRQARSAGIFVLSSLQRPDKTNLDPNLKNLFNIKIAFRANNIASSKVLTDDSSAFNLPNREALFMGSFQKTLKTPYIDDNLIYNLLNSKYETNHKYIDIFPPEVKKCEAEKTDCKKNKGIKPAPKSKGVVKKC